MNNILDTKHNSSDIYGREQVAPENARPNPPHALRRIVHAFDLARDVSINTVSKPLVDAGEACAAFHDAAVRGVKAQRVLCDEIWSFTYAKQKNVLMAKAAPEQAGDTWTWTVLVADSKLIVSHLVGGRDSEYAMAFMDDVAARLANCVQMTMDGHRACLEAVEGAFGADVGYPQLVKIYRAAPESDKGRASPPECTGIRKTRTEGEPDIAHVSTILCRAPEPHHADALAPIYSADQRLFQEARTTRIRSRFTPCFIISAKSSRCALLLLLRQNLQIASKTLTGLWN